MKQKRLQSRFWYKHRNTEEEETAFALMSLRTINKEQLKIAKEWFCACKKEQHRQMNNVVMESEIHNGDHTIQNRFQIMVMNKLDSTVQEASVCAMLWSKNKSRAEEKRNYREAKKTIFSAQYNIELDNEGANQNS